MDKTFKQVCKCENCGNEAEMMITCTLPEEAAETSGKPNTAKHSHDKGKLKGTGTCSNCGNEADMWIDQ